MGDMTITTPLYGLFDLATSIILHIECLLLSLLIVEWIMAGGLYIYVLIMHGLLIGFQIPADESV